MALLVYHNRIQNPFPKSLLEKTLVAVFDSLGISPRCEVSLHLIGDAHMKRLNGTYRGKQKTTDVLSFPTDDRLIDAGDIFISIPQIIWQAKEWKVSPKEEFVRIFIHGLLHLFDFDHEKEKEAEKMFELQEKLVKEVLEKKKRKQKR